MKRLTMEEIQELEAQIRYFQNKGPAKTKEEVETRRAIQAKLEPERKEQIRLKFQKEVKEVIKKYSLDADYKKIVACVNEMGSFLHNNLWSDILRELYKGIVRPYFQKQKIDSKGYYTKEETAALLGISKSRVEQLVPEGKLKYLPKTYNRKNRRTILGAVIKKYLQQIEK